VCYRRLSLRLYPHFVDVEINPEPSEEERQAILAALELNRSEPVEPTPWWRAGLEREAEQEDYATAPRRQSLGATRA
jgi:hypothetical protein